VPPNAIIYFLLILQSCVKNIPNMAHND
jgi:hypothetical protein